MQHGLLVNGEVGRISSSRKRCSTCAWWCLVHVRPVLSEGVAHHGTTLANWGDQTLAPRTAKSDCANAFRVGVTGPVAKTSTIMFVQNTGTHVLVALRNPTPPIQATAFAKASHRSVAPPELHMHLMPSEPRTPEGGCNPQVWSGRNLLKALSPPGFARHGWQKTAHLCFEKRHFEERVRPIHNDIDRAMLGSQKGPRGMFRSMSFGETWFRSRQGSSTNMP